MKKYPLVFFFIFSMGIFSSCKKEGTGGMATIAAFPKHHETPVKGATVYVKFGAKEFPGKNFSDYDLAVKGATSEEHIHIENLKWGDYYLYAVGYDSTIFKEVRGGLAIKIKRSEREEEMDAQIHVTEEN